MPNGWDVLKDHLLSSSALALTITVISAYHTQRPNNLNSLVQIFFSRKRDQIRLISTRIRHQLYQFSQPARYKYLMSTHPNPHLGDNSQVTLREQSVVVRTKAVRKQLPAFISRFFVWPSRFLARFSWLGHGAHPSADEFAIWQDNFHAAVHHPVVYLR